MTDEFKQTLFDYLIGKLPNEQGATEEIFKEINEISRDEWVDFLPNGGTWSAMRIEGLIVPSENTNNLTVIYGGYRVDNNSNGFIILLDNNFVPIKKFEAFNTGTNLRYIQKMEISEDGTFYAIDDNVYTYDNSENSYNSQKRFIMLNNFTQFSTTLNDYALSLQRSYILPSNCLNFYCKYMTKNPNSAHYFLAGSSSSNYDGSWDYDGSRYIELKINVGSENEWKTEATNASTGLVMQFSGVFAIFNEDDKVSFRFLTTNGGVTGVLYSLFKDFDSNSWSSERIIEFNIAYYGISNFINKQVCFLNIDEVYFVCSNLQFSTNVSGDYNKNKVIGIHHYTFSTKQLSTIHQEDFGLITSPALKRGINLTTLNNDLYILYITDDDMDNIADYYLFRYKGNWSPKLIAQDKPFWWTYADIFIKINFNLLQMFVYQSTLSSSYWNQILIKENYNSSNYNGEPYVNTNALIPNSAEIYSNDSLVFARNLYNKTINNNTTVSTVEVPNTYLNNIDLTSKNLLSETNLTMVADTNVTQKNIYETMFLNFINVLQVAGRNNVTQVLNQEASTYLNSAINTDDSYDNAKLYNKVIINYQDGSSKESSYSLENTTETSTVIAFGLYIDKLINNAEIVSNDKTITYQTIDLSSLELNKYYAIRQKMEVV
ncbi:MAG TPA: hypothetical protein IAB59_00350 [Candidatus Onthousia faecipullorum]|uniref:Uncharacterized protein n=1 Tax=Candidatus Onthousia faecipullorum TaxID=2840887 RepID=A0A9D1G9T0_9FIRM|nr:hypothetical protein [Candidatus Onthousia faecipullorum]